MSRMMPTKDKRQKEKMKKKEKKNKEKAKEEVGFKTTELSLVL